MGYADAEKRSSAGHLPGFSLPYYLGASAASYAVWVMFAAVGTVLGPTIGNVNDYGVDMAFPACSATSWVEPLTKANLADGSMFRGPVRAAAKMSANATI